MLSQSDGILMQKSLRCRRLAPLSRSSHLKTSEDYQRSRKIQKYKKEDPKNFRNTRKKTKKNPETQERRSRKVQKNEKEDQKKVQNLKTQFFSQREQVVDPRNKKWPSLLPLSLQSSHFNPQNQNEGLAVVSFQCSL